MCGIQVIISDEKSDIKHNEYISRRGPSYDNCMKININNYQIYFYSSVLHLRCKDLIKQPYVCLENNDILCYNGEIFHSLKDGESDTSYFMTLLNNSSSPAQLLSQLQGPIAFVYWNSNSRTLWFGRDYLGRRSLVYQSSTNRIEIASVVLHPTNVENWQEVDVKGIYYIKFNESCSDQLKLEPLIINRTDYIPHQLSLSTDVTFSSLLTKSIQQRTVEVFPRNQMSVGILFSGGIDCMVMAAIASKFIPNHETIDLINVAFVGNETHQNNKKFIKSIPDRLTSINGYLELKRVYPNTKWRLIEVDVTLNELETNRERIINLIAPCNTVMDFNIGSILWFGARAKGYVRKYDDKIIDSPLCRYTNHNNDDKETINVNELLIKQENEMLVTSPCRVLFVGIGADEQLAGYRRHRGIYKKKGAKVLKDELNADVERLWWRNLGRDDRCISDWGREARHPYLDDQLVQFLHHLPIKEICNLDLPSGIGDKLILREMACNELHLQLSSSLEKRAMQFGTRLANRKYPGQNKINNAKLNEICHQQFIK